MLQRTNKEEAHETEKLLLPCRALAVVAKLGGLWSKEVSKGGGATYCD